MDFDQCVHAKAPCRVEEALERLRRQDTRNQQHGIRAEHPCLVDLVCIDDEVLAQKRQADLRADLAEILVAAEEMRVCVHGEHARAIVLVDPRELRDGVTAAEPPLRRALELALGNEVPVALAEAVRHRERPGGERALHLIERHLALRIGDDILLLLDNLC